jgi:hypothetical protein
MTLETRVLAYETSSRKLKENMGFHFLQDRLE